MVQKNLASVPAPRGRPRSFNTDEVLARVRDTFWRYGYAGTSMDQLSTATGLHKPSLYGAFGDKKRLYLADSLYAVTERSIEKYTGEVEGGTGCFMMNTAMPEAAEDPEISRVVRESMDGLDRALFRRFQKAIDSGELPQSADPQALAMILVANNYELSAKARAGYSRAELRMLADRALDLVRRVAGAPAGEG